jgi:hypothetical protein
MPQIATTSLLKKNHIMLQIATTSLFKEKHITAQNMAASSVATGPIGNTARSVTTAAVIAATRTSFLTIRDFAQNS